MTGTVWIVQTTLPGDWLEPHVGAWSATLVEGGLAACVQRNRVTSVYSWEGATQSAEEWRVQIKTSEAKKDDLMGAILSEHPYQTPQIAIWEAESTDDYAGWVEG
ncbi:MAG: divalent cation tolerance protein CutA [Candidatus Thalassarchaeaceae archaeon]|jgi:periplasmic divalent cation tolerance protein|nr:divalent cation tolerance protein CutA [Candidatus Thalassarchaeaceae archaeon]MDP7091277.1 divalent cation tolerance protein CutA [Candidatus Thalassarchaeaceae archaeon]MDP7257515.1 divalent cation tolerance protein CutA [Candidatus Thalassarchaeaceae archaeon]MDP7445767.1 divalent cation tolerance protein CutA [Candidatus Thalassarchaeaceae archaeon]MDP7649012.1 divalent cation tolerance protein CutA [Candidatus Thalassarchaeaceae archaeon]|tara:strand:+ start:8600 stop:8914 length:315 start_codon:yes stop_codon:yes gene_type:complete